MAKQDLKTGSNLSNRRRNKATRVVEVVRRDGEGRMAAGSRSDEVTCVCPISVCCPWDAAAACPCLARARI